MEPALVHAAGAAGAGLGAVVDDLLDLELEGQDLAAHLFDEVDLVGLGQGLELAFVEATTLPDAGPVHLGLGVAGSLGGDDQLVVLVLGLDEAPGTGRVGAGRLEGDPQQRLAVELVDLEDEAGGVLGHHLLEPVLVGRLDDLFVDRVDLGDVRLVVQSDHPLVGVDPQRLEVPVPAVPMSFPALRLSVDAEMFGWDDPVEPVPVIDPFWAVTFT